METKTKKHYWFQVVIALLIIACVGETAYIYRITHKKPDQFTNPDAFTSFINNQFQQDNKRLWANFDNYFNDDFFQKNSDPFSAMEKVYQRVENMIDPSFKDPFRQSWDSWIDRRFQGADDKIRTASRETKDAYIITLTAPDFKNNQLNINVDENGISIKGDISKMVENKDSKGSIISRNKTEESISEKFPIPADANYKTAHIENHNNKIVITLPKNKPA